MIAMTMMMLMKNWIKLEHYFYHPHEVYGPVHRISNGRQSIASISIHEAPNLPTSLNHSTFAHTQFVRTMKPLKKELLQRRQCLLARLRMLPWPYCAI